MCPDVGVQMYADDTVVYVAGKNPDAASSILTRTLEKVSDWLKSSCLTLNQKKTKYLCFSLKRSTSSNNLNIEMNGEPTEQGEEENIV